MKKKAALAILLQLAISMASQPFNAKEMKPLTHDFYAPQQKNSVGDAKPGDSREKPLPPASPGSNGDCGCVLRTSPIDPGGCNDSAFLVDCDTGLDTGCTFRSGGPLIFTIKINRVVGNVEKLKDKGLIGSTATLMMPAFDVDFNGGGGGFNGERDRVSFNDHVVPEEFLNGLDNQWVMNTFTIPIEWVKFPSDPGAGHTVMPAVNIIRIDIDTANTDEVWCTAIDWAKLLVQVARPVVMVHGIFSDGETWDRPQPNNPCLPFPPDPPDLFSWVNELNDSGLPKSRLNMGCLDTIQSNASQIAAEVADARRRWGVDKVNLVCHSKGGLDARHFVENNDSVEQLIQRGTPNLGSPLADIAQGIGIATLGVGGTVIVNGLVGLGGVQLTTPFMLGYNLFHGRNNKVQYTALAGDYRQDCPFLNPFCRGMDSVFLLLTGTGDTIVPIGSAHALSYTQDRTFSSSGGNTNATHGMLTGSNGVFTSVQDRVHAFGTKGSVQALPAPPTHTATASGTITQGQVQNRTISIDQSTPIVFSLMYPSGNLDMALISPSGQRFDPTTIVGNPNVSREERVILGGIAEVYTFNAPEVGIWTVEVRAPSVIDPSGSVTYAVIGWFQNPAITLSGSAEKLNLHSGERLRLFGALNNKGAPVTGATVIAMIALPDDSKQILSLHDDGINGDAVANDGIYTGDSTNTSQSGNYRILLVANRAASPGNPAFSREAFLLATVSVSSSAFTGVFRDFGLDTDGDDLFNYLVVEADLNITHSASYRVFGILTDSQGNTHEGSAQAALNPGANTLSLKFNGEEIFQNRVNGPYQLATIRLAEEKGTDTLPVDEFTKSFQTAGYSFRDFQHGPLSLTGSGSDSGIDTNGNGLFDLLTVGIDMEVVNSGSYNWTAQLTDRNGKRIGFAANAGFLNPGLNTLNLTYDGTQIGLNRVDGPYFVTGLIVFGSGGSLVAQKAFTTSPFLASQFEGSCQIICPANIIKPNDLGQCGAIVSYPPPNPASACNTVTCNPPSGAFFPVGTTTVNCSGGNAASCSFTVTVRDEELPRLTCPPNITTVTNSPGNPSAVVNFPPIIGSDNCPGVTVTCTPSSGSSFPVGTSNVSCKATDKVNSSTSCNFTVTVFDARLQDDSNSGKVVLFVTSGAQKGLYRFCYGSTPLTGIGTITKQGSTYLLQHNPSDRRVRAIVDSSQRRGNASLQLPPGNNVCNIQDRDIRNDSNICP